MLIMKYSDSTNKWNGIVLNYFSSIKPAKGFLTKYLRLAEENAVYRFIKDYSYKKDITILDIASEPRIYLYLRRHHFNITRIDFVSCYKDYILERTTKKDYIFDPRFIISPSNIHLNIKYDIVICIGLFNYFPYISKLNNFCYDHLKTDGKFISTFKTKQHPDSIIKHSYDKTYNVMDLKNIFLRYNVQKIIPLANNLPKIKGKWSYFVQFLVPLIYFNDKIDRDINYYFKKERAWYYAICAKKK